MSAIVFALAFCLGTVIGFALRSIRLKQTIRREVAHARGLARLDPYRESAPLAATEPNRTELILAAGLRAIIASQTDRAATAIAKDALVAVGLRT